MCNEKLQNYEHEKLKMKLKGVANQNLKPFFLLHVL